eukprot:ctg_95.g115
MFVQTPLGCNRSGSSFHFFTGKSVLGVTVGGVRRIRYRHSPHRLFELIAQSDRGGRDHAAAAAAAASPARPSTARAEWPIKRQLGESDLLVTNCCLGTMTWGEQNTAAEAHQQLDYAIHERGLNFIDCAEAYPVPPRPETQGATERILGQWLRQNRALRSQLVLASKVCGPGRFMNWIRGGPQLDRRSIIDACHASLERLGVDTIDLYQIHWPARRVPLFGEHAFPDPHSAAEAEALVPSVETQLEAMQQLVRDGKVRYVGLSNETPVGMMEFAHAAERAGLPRVVSVQNSYSLLHREFEGAHAEASARCHAPLLVYSPLAGGVLSGKYLPDTDPQQRENSRFTIFQSYMERFRKPSATEAVRQYAQVARRFGKTPAQLALSFVRTRWFVGSVIVGATRVEHLQENLAAFDEHSDAGRWDADMEQAVNEVYLNGYRDVALGV